MVVDNDTQSGQGNGRDNTPIIEIAVESPCVRSGFGCPSLLTCELIDRMNYSPWQNKKMVHKVLNIVSYNTHGVCGDMVTYNKRQASGKLRCLETLLTRSDITCIQESHADELEAEHLASVWKISHILTFSNGETRNQGGLLIAIKIGWALQFDLTFSLEVFQVGANYCHVSKKASL